MNEELQHHGILGQKWGVRRYQNKDGSLTPAGEQRYGSGQQDHLVLKKGHKTFRVANDLNDATYANRKYVSINKKDHAEWQKTYGYKYSQAGQQAYNVMYKTTKDLTIAPYQELAKLYLEKQKDVLARTKIEQDTVKAVTQLNYAPEDAHDAFSINLVAETETGKMFIDELMKRGYQGVEDYHGRDVSENPVVIFDPDHNLKKVKTKKLRYR